MVIALARQSCRRWMCLSLAPLLVVIFSSFAAAQEAELQQMFDIAKELEVLADRAAVLNHELDEIRRVYGDPWNGPKRLRAK